MKTINIAPKIEKAGYLVVGIIAAMASLFLSVVSLMHTTVVDDVKEGEGVMSVVYNIPERLECVYYLNDNFILNLLILAVLLLDAFLLIRHCKKIKLRTICIGLFLWTFALGIFWVLSSQCAPTEDSATVTNASVAFAQNDYAVLSDIRYFNEYPFQLGYVFFNEIILRFAGLFRKPDTLIILEVLNAAFLGVIHLFLVLITEKLLHDRRVTALAAVLLALSTAPLISCSFVYGIYPGMMFAVIAMYCEICYLLDNKLPYAVIAALSITLAVMVKPNYMIWMIAMLLIAAVCMLKRKKYLRDGIYIVLTAVLACSIQPLVIRGYEKASGVDIKGTVPYIGWIAMGINETYLAPGWYNVRYTIGLIEEADFNEEVAKERGWELVRERVDFLLHHPQYTSDFFYLKNVSQWNDTAYESIWNNTVRGQYKDKGKFAVWVCGEGKSTVKKIMDLFAQLVFFGFFIGCIRLLREKNFMLTPLPVVFIGGFLYHMISEGKSQYVLPYFIAMTGFAAAGIVWLGDLFVRRLKPDHLLYGALGGSQFLLEPAAESHAEPVKAEAEPESPANNAETPADAKPDAPKQQKSGNQKNKKKKKR